MPNETPDGDARAQIEAIYEEVRRLYGAPYVSAIHYSLATQPGFLEWAWTELAPTFRSGKVQEAAWAAAARLDAPSLAPIAWPALRVWGLDARDVASVRAAAQTFVRVAPVNMMFAALIKLRLEGFGSSGRNEENAVEPWQAPEPPAASLPAMIDLDRADQTTRDIASLFATDLDGSLFVPGLYRMLLQWPAFAAHLATDLIPRLRSRSVTLLFDELRSLIDDAAPTVLSAPPHGGSNGVAPSDVARNYFMRISATYRRTSPELVIAGMMLENALPRTVD